MNTILKLFKKNEFNQYNPSDKKKFPRKVKFLNPKSFKELDEKLNFKNSILINNIISTFEHYKILRFIRKKNVPQIVVSNIGNIQGSVFYFCKKNMNYYIQKFSTHFPKKLAVILLLVTFRK